MLGEYVLGSVYVYIMPIYGGEVFLSGEVNGNADEFLYQLSIINYRLSVIYCSFIFAFLDIILLLLFYCLLIYNII